MYSSIYLKSWRRQNEPGMIEVRRVVALGVKGHAWEVAQECSGVMEMFYILIGV